MSTEQRNPSVNHTRASAAKPAGLVLAAALLASPAGGQTARPWETYEIELTAQTELSNAYVEGLPDKGPPRVRATFTGVGGDAKGLRYTIAGFWDGGRTWRVRFAPPAAGEWSYVSSSPDAGLSGARGRFTCSAWTEEEKAANPTRRGFLRVARGGPRPGRHFAYADGTPFLWIGDTWWNWARKEIYYSTFQKLADDRAAKGFTVGQMYLSGNDRLLGRDHDAPDLDAIRHIEQFVRYANSKGITVWIHPWWSRKGLNERVGAEKMRRWWRYVAHRFGAYNVIWVLGGEYNMNNYGGLGLQFWKDLGILVRSEDPYGRIIGTHPTPPGWQGGAEAPQWSTGEVLHAEPWLDYNQSQVGHGKWRNEMIPSVVAADYARRPAKPVVVTEPWYEFIEGNPPAEEIRLGAWSAVLSGAAGHTYGGGQVWWAHVPEAPIKQGNWPLQESFEKDTLDYPGAVSISFMARFLKSLEWWRLEPHPELVSGYPARFCSAVPGREYVVYLRYGGALKLDLRPSAPGDVFRYSWIDLTQSRTAREGAVEGGMAREFHSPEDYPGQPRHKDWLLHVRRNRD